MRRVKLRWVLLFVLTSTVLCSWQWAPAQTGGAGGANADKKDEGIKAAPGPFTLLWRQMAKGDFVGWTALLLSIAGMTLIVQGFIKARPTVMIPEASNNHIRELIGARQFKELIEFTESDPSFVSKALNPALKRAPSFAAMKEAMETAVAENSAQEFRRIEYLNIIGNLGPLLGLLGTVMGMVDSFGQVEAASGAANPKALSGGIAQALAHTFAGLMLALPCLASFGILRTLIDRLTVQAR